MAGRNHGNFDIALRLREAQLSRSATEEAYVATTNIYAVAGKPDHALRGVYISMIQRGGKLMRLLSLAKLATPLILAGVLCCFGCGSDEEPNGDTGSPESAETTTSEDNGENEGGEEDNETDNDVKEPPTE